MLVDVITRLQHKGRLDIAFLRDQLVTQRRKLIGKKCEQPHNAIVFFRWEQRIFLPGSANFTLKLDSASLEFPANLSRIPLRRDMPQHLSDAEVTDDLLAQV